MLSDLKVLEYGNFISAPYCGKLLAEMGADVIKVEAPSAGDASRSFGPFPGDAPHRERSGLFLYLNLNKRSVTLDPANATGAQIFRELAFQADLLIENFPPGYLDSLGIGYEQLETLNPRLIMVSITPYGQSGPYSNYKGTDLTCNNLGGLAWNTPPVVKDAPNHPPLRPGGHQADFVAGLFGAVAAVGAVFSQGATGRGEHLDVSETECIATYMRQGFSYYHYDPEGIYRIMWGTRDSTTKPANPTQQLWPCQDGWFAMQTTEEYQWRRFLEVMGNPEWGNDERFGSGVGRRDNYAELEPLVLEWTMRHTMQEIFELGQARKVPVFRFNTVDEVLRSPQLQAREFFTGVKHPEAGTVMVPGRPFKVDCYLSRIIRPAPCLGEHNQDVLGELGYSPEDLVRLRRLGVV